MEGDHGEMIPGTGEAVAYSEELGAEICARVAAGETVAAICRGAGTPDKRTVGKWLAGRPEFRARMEAARAAAGGALAGPRSTYCQETAEAILSRVMAGEGVVAVCRDPAMPAASTVYKWRREQADFDEALRLARDVQSEALFERGLSICEEMTPETCRRDEVRLRHLRWSAAKLAPRRYGEFERVAPEEDGGGALTVILKRFVLDGTPGGREEEGPGELLYTMTAAQRAGRIEGEHPGTTAWKARQAKREAERKAAAEAAAASEAAASEAAGGPPAEEEVGYGPGGWWRDDGGPKGPEDWL